MREVWYPKHKDDPQIKARLLVRSAVRNKTLIIPLVCSLCTKGCKPQAHHEDYTKPLEIIWMCTKCHREADMSRVEGGESWEAHNLL